MPRVVHFEITADDPQRAIAFYRDVFGWEFQKWDGPMDYWMVTTGPKGQMGIDGGVVARQGTAGHINTIDVPSVDDYAARIVAGGGKVLMPKVAVPGVGYLAYCQDTEGSTFGIMQMDQAAA
jgi:predicted enzyme related to lactoylglutathione lyase